MSTEALVPGQVIIPAAAIGLGFLVVVAVGFVIAVVWVVACWWRDRRHDVGPDALRLLEDLDAHLDEYVAEHPDVAAGFARLRAAVRDEQQNGGESA